MSKLYTSYFEPVQLTPPHEARAAYFYYRGKGVGEELRRIPVEALAIVEVVDVVADAPGWRERLIGGPYRRPLYLILDEYRERLVNVETYSYGSTSLAFLGFGPGDLTFAEMDGEPYYFNEELEIIREESDNDLCQREERLFPAYQYHQADFARLFAEARARAAVTWD